MQDDFESTEKDYVRKNQWDLALNKLIKEKKFISVFEFLGQRDNFWRNTKNKYPEKTFTVDGVTIDEQVILDRSLYRTVFHERYDKLLKSKDFLSHLPYDIMNLDYCGGGRLFEEEPYRYHKFPDIAHTINENIKRTDSFYILITFDSADLVYPFKKVNPDVIKDSPVAKEALSFLDSLENLDLRPYWLMIFGNAFETLRFCAKNKYGIKLITPVITYISESKGHKTRMVSWTYRISKDIPVEDIYKSVSKILQNTIWLQCKELVCKKN